MFLLAASSPATLPSIDLGLGSLPVYALLFVFAFGLGTVLILLGSFSGLLASLPKAGPWMVRVQKAFGWVLIAMGEYFLIKAGQLTI